MRSKSIIVLCWGSSGSSMIAGMLQRLCIFMLAKEQGYADGRHARGYWEDGTWNGALGHIFGAAGHRGWTGIKTAEEYTKVVENNPKVLKPIANYINRRDGDNKNWGVKSPFLAFLIHILHPMFKDPYYIWWQRRITLEHGAAFAQGIAKDVNERIGNFLIGGNGPRKRYIKLVYEDVLENPDAAIDAVEDLINDGFTIEQRKAAKEMADKSLNFHPEEKK